MGEGVRVGVGTDIAGGAEPGLLRQCAHAVTASRLLHDGVDGRRAATERGVEGSSIDAVTAFHLGTVGGAEVLGALVGLFAPGRQFDALVVDVDAGGPLRVWSQVDDHLRVFEKIVHLAGPAEVRQVWVAGRLVSPEAPATQG